MNNNTIAGSISVIILIIELLGFIFSLTNGLLIGYFDVIISIVCLRVIYKTLAKKESLGKIDWAIFIVIVILFVFSFVIGFIMAYLWS